MTHSTNDQLMAMAAVRYCLPRSSYIVGACCEWVRENWKAMTRETRNVILRDVHEALERGEVGHHMDRREWDRLEGWMRVQPEIPPLPPE